jgi:hypothetical protein
VASDPSLLGFHALRTNGENFSAVERAAGGPIEAGIGKAASLSLEVKLGLRVIAIVVNALHRRLGHESLDCRELMNLAKMRRFRRFHSDISPAGIDRRQTNSQHNQAENGHERDCSG